MRHLLILLAVLGGAQFTTAQQYATFIMVAQDGSGDFSTIQSAIDASKAFPDQRITIHIKPGIYKEKVKVHAWNTLLSLEGENALTTIISHNDHFGNIHRGRNSTFFTPTLLVQGDGFRASHLTIINTAGPVGQAIALAVEADGVSLFYCRILGHQDTFYAAGSRARIFVSNCYIEGTTDFIFGPATVFFDKCQIHSKSNSFITASATPLSIPFGFVFYQCKLTAEPGIDSVYLGRPWRDYARVVFIKCNLGKHILPEGWASWNGATLRGKTAFFAEYKNIGNGNHQRNRVPWSHQLSFFRMLKYSPHNVMGCRNQRQFTTQFGIQPN